MGLIDDITNSFRRKLREGVDNVSDKEAEAGWDELEDKDLDNDGDTDKSDSYLYKRQGTVAKMDEEELDEMSTTAGVPGYMTPKAFGDADEDTYTQGGMKKVKKTNKIFVPMESKSSYKAMMAEMYGVDSELNEASNPELDKMVKRFIDGLSNKYGYRSSDAIMAMFEALKRLDYIHKSVNYKAPSGFTVEEAVSYRDYKRDETASPSQKVNKGIQEVNAMLAEIEKIVHNNLRLKTEMGVNSNQFWKKTSGRISKINERIVRISNKLKELSK
jgi:hypothetical protein